MHLESVKCSERTKEIKKLLLLAEEKKPAVMRFEAQKKAAVIHAKAQKKADIMRFETQHENTFAKAAAADNHTRRRAKSIKPQVEKTSDCPYCGCDLGATPHLDHIYPVSKGGLSIVENLVWCCAKCNSIKTNIGLTQFLRIQGLPIEPILSRLHSLGKHV